MQIVELKKQQQKTTETEYILITLQTQINPKSILQRGSAIRTKPWKQQYLAQENATSACVTHPDACTNGGSMAFWVNLLQDQEDGILLSSCEYAFKSCIRISTYVL